MMPATDAPPERFFAALTGTSQTASSDVRLRNPGTDAMFSRVRWGIRPQEPTPYYVAQYGQFVRPRLALMVDFTHNKAVADPFQRVSASGTWKGAPIATSPQLVSYIQKLRYTNGLNTLGLVALYRGAGPESRFQPTFGAGPHYAILWSRNIVEGQENKVHYRGVGFGWQAQAGFRYRLTSALALQAEVKYTDSPGQAVTAQDGRIDTRLRSVHETFGLV